MTWYQLFQGWVASLWGNMVADRNARVVCDKKAQGASTLGFRCLGTRSRGDVLAIDDVVGFHLLGVVGSWGREGFEQSRDQAGPAGLVSGAEALAGVAVEELVEGDQVPPAGVAGETGVVAVAGAAALRA